jgi:hypothetical protein
MRTTLLRASGAACLLGSIVVLSGCGDGSEAPPPVIEEETLVEETVEEAPTGLAAPGSRMGLGSSAGGSSNGGGGAFDGSSDDSSFEDGGADAVVETSNPEPPPRGGASDASLPEPPKTAIPVAEPKDGIEAVYEDPKGLERGGSDPRFAEFRKLCEQNTEIMVRLARARQAMKKGGPSEQEAYLKIDGQYAQFSERLNDYMAQRRWSDQDREVMGYLLSVSNEEALRRVRAGS